MLCRVYDAITAARRLTTSTAGIGLNVGVRATIVASLVAVHDPIPTARGGARGATDIRDVLVFFPLVAVFVGVNHTVAATGHSTADTTASAGFIGVLVTRRGGTLSAHNRARPIVGVLFSDVVIHRGDSDEQAERLPIL